MIIQIIAATSTALFISYFSGIGRRINFRPFNCSMCMAGWLGASLFFIPELVSQFLIVMFGSACIAAVAEKYLAKW